jgi:oligopeptidase B
MLCRGFTAETGHLSVCSVAPAAYILKSLQTDALSVYLCQPIHNIMNTIRQFSLFFCICLTGAILGGCNQKSSDTMKPPIAAKIPHELTAHGQTRIDPYYWMNQRENPKVVEYLEAENAYTDAMLKPVKGLRDDLYNEIVGRIKKDDESVPYLENGYFYQTRYRGDSEYPLYYRWPEKAELSKAELLFDINELAKGYAYFSDSYHNISPDNSLAAIGFDTVSRRNYTIRFKNLNNGAWLNDQIPMTTGSVAWAKDNRTVFYTVRDQQTLRSFRIMKHVLGNDPASDKIVFEEKDETFTVRVYNSKSDHHIIIASTSTMTSEMRLLDASRPDGEFVIVEPRRRGHEYYIYPTANTIYIKTNQDAKNFRLMVTNTLKPASPSWKEILPHRPDVLIEDLEVFNDYVVVQERSQGLGRFNIIDLKGKSHFMRMEEESFVLDKSINAELNAGVFRYVYSSLTTPRSVIEYDMNKRQKTLLKETEVLGGFKKSDYETKRLFASAADGTKVPVTVVYRKGMKQDGTNPALLYAYGSYGYSTDPWFRSSILSLLDRGFVYAIAHVRGGEEMGREWYEEGKLLKKMNTFTDFIACSEFLIREKYTTSEKLFASGGSAGGLLMGVISNLRPDLYKGIIAAVPFVDVVTTMLDESIPLTTGEYDEWGNPNQKEYYDYMLSYSPYDNVSSQDYCNMLITTGFHDSQVQYWEPAKWTARLREMNTSDNLILLHTNMDFGHGGASGRFQVYHEIAMEYAFMLMLLDN